MIKLFEKKGESRSLLATFEAASPFVIETSEANPRGCYLPIVLYNGIVRDWDKVAWFRSSGQGFKDLEVVQADGTSVFLFDARVNDSRWTQLGSGTKGTNPYEVDGDCTQLNCITLQFVYFVYAGLPEASAPPQPEALGFVCVDSSKELWVDPKTRPYGLYLQKTKQKKRPWTCWYYTPEGRLGKVREATPVAAIEMLEMLCQLALRDTQEVLERAKQETQNRHPEACRGYR